MIQKPVDEYIFFPCLYVALTFRKEDTLLIENYVHLRWYSH